MEMLSRDEVPSDLSGAETSGLLTLSDGRSVPYVVHPLAARLPTMSGPALAAFTEDVRQHGVRRPIVLLDGQVLDGRHRYHAAREVGCGYDVVDFIGDDPVAFVLSENVHRRHLSETTRALMAADFAKLGRGNPAFKSASVRNSETTAEVAKRFEVSPRLVESAKAVVRDATPTLVAMVERNETSLAAAVAVAKLPEAEQVEIVAQGPDAVRAAAKESRAPKAPADKRPANGLSGLTREGLEDAVTGLRTENADLRSQLATVKTERDDLKARLKEATAEDQGKVIGALQKQLQAAKFSRDEALAATKRMEFKLKKAEARVKELEETPIDMGQP